MRLLVPLLLAIALLISATYVEMRGFRQHFETLCKDHKRQHFFDRDKKRLNTTYTNRYNCSDLIALDQLPKFFLKALILSEDKNFYTHSGVDWGARFRALWHNILHQKRVEGASSITEQVVRMLHKRERNLWSKWVEGFEAHRLQQQLSKEEILHFYINQIPYAANRRGVKQAASYYFDKELQSLNDRELLALVVMIRSPRWYNPFKDPKRLQKKILQLASRLHHKGIITTLEYEIIKKSHLQLRSKTKHLNAEHFISFVSSQLSPKQLLKQDITTTLDTELQSFAQQRLNTKIASLAHRNVNNGAVIVIDHRSSEILAWVVAFAGEKGRVFNHYDPLLVPRQPGSTLKPFLYALALQKRWEASTLINDAPLSEGVGIGMHSYHNYSNRYYGDITLREALGNSLNIPAIKTIQFVGVEPFLKMLHSLGITTLTQHPNYYGDGIALGNSEVSLYELTRAYSVLARMGIYKNLDLIRNSPTKKSKRVLLENVSSLIANILSDPTARSKEFGRDSILNLPHQSAIKTGTSSDYRDAWCIGFDDRYTIGVWFGNMNYESMKNVTGSSGPAHVLKTLFTHLSKNRENRPLFLSSKLIKKRLCIKESKNEDQPCKMVDEFLLHSDREPMPNKASEIKIIAPTKNLILAKDPRIPDEMEYYTFRVKAPESNVKIEWYLNNALIATTTKPSFEWAVKRGSYNLHVKVFLESKEVQSGLIHFSVK